MLPSFTSNPPIPLHRHKHTPGGTHTHTCIWQYSPVLSRSTVPTSQPPRPNFKVAQPRRTRLGLPERLSLGSGVTGSRGLKLILSLWSCSALFSLLSSCSAPYRSRISRHLQSNQVGKKVSFLSLSSPCLSRWEILPLVHDALTDKEPGGVIMELTALFSIFHHGHLSLCSISFLRANGERTREVSIEGNGLN